MHRALRTPELFYHIFEHLGDNGDVFSCALTCKMWSEPALDTLWRNLEQIGPLLSLLAPIRMELDVEASMAEYERPIRVSDWSTFERCAGRVRSLNLRNDFSGFVQAVYIEIAQKRPSMTLLPRLTRLEVSVDADTDTDVDSSQYLLHSLLFANEGVREFSLLLSSENMEVAEGIPDVFEMFMARMPNLRRFELCTDRTDWPISSIEEHIARWMSSLTQLVSYSCADHFTTPCIMEALSKLPLLQKIEFNRIGNGYGEDMARTFRPSIGPGAFAALSTLEFCAKLDDAISFLREDFAPGLTGVSVHTPRLETAEALKGFLSGLSEARPSLERLRLDSVHSTRRPLTDENKNETDRVVLETLEPVRALRELVELRISYHRTFQLSKRDLCKLLDGWCHLETLCLCSDPILSEKAKLGPSALLVIALCCPRLRHLSLHFRTNCKTFHVCDEPVRFQSLESIKFGTSYIADNNVSKVASFLSNILPPTCRVDSLCGTDWLRARVLPAVHNDRVIKREVRDRWKEVSRAVKMLFEVRAEEQLRYDQLSKKCDDLATRNSELETRCKELEETYDALLVFQKNVDLR